MVKIEDRQVVRQKESRGWRMESTGVRQKGLRRWRMESKECQARENEEIDGVESRQAKVSEKMEDVVESVRPGVSRQRILDWRPFEEYQKKPMEWACARQ